jgi:CheY-like chemotaxis protein
VPTPAVHTAALAARGGKKTLLLVEDDHSLRMLLRAILQRNGYRVLDAANGREALSLCESSGELIDLVLTDVVMPHMSGRELAERLSRSRRGLKVLYMRGNLFDACPLWPPIPSCRHAVSPPETDRRRLPGPRRHASTVAGANTSAPRRACRPSRIGLRPGARMNDWRGTARRGIGGRPRAIPR